MRVRVTMRLRTTVEFSSEDMHDMDRAANDNGPKKASALLGEILHTMEEANRSTEINALLERARELGVEAG